MRSAADAAWPLRVVVVTSASVQAGSVREAVVSRDVELSYVPDVFTALLLLGREEAHALVLPSDLEHADLGAVVGAVVQWCDLPVVVAMAPDTTATEHAAAAVEAGCAGLLPVPFGYDDIRGAVSRTARRDRGGKADRLLVGGLTIDLGGLTVTGSNGQVVQLSSMQFACLYALVRSCPAVVRLPVLSDELGLRGTGTANRTRRLVARLRRQIELATGGEDLIENVKGVGYRLRA